MTMCMQLNDATDYSIVIGKTDGLVPSKHKGRGLVALDRVYEFQTAYCTDAADTFDYLSDYCEELKKNADVFAKSIPVLPEIVKYEDVSGAVTDLVKVPVGIGKKSLNVMSVGIQNRVVLPVVSQEAHQSAGFVEEWLKVLCPITNVVCIDAEQILDSDKLDGAEVIRENYEEYVHTVFADTVNRNNTFKDAKMDPKSLEGFEEKVVVIVGYKRFLNQLTPDGQEKISLVLLKSDACYKLHFILVDSLSEFSSVNYEEWYKKQITGAEGIWIGDGFADQYMLKANKITNELYEEIGDEYGYILNRNRPTLVKLLSSAKEEAE